MSKWNPRPAYRVNPNAYHAGYSDAFHGHDRYWTYGGRRDVPPGYNTGFDDGLSDVGGGGGSEPDHVALLD